jgi:hypothetical protein
LQLLFALNRPVRVAENSIEFIQKLSRDILREQGRTIPENFSESWVFSASLNIASECEGKLSAKKTRLHFLLGDLYYNARRKVFLFLFLY